MTTKPNSQSIVVNKALAREHSVNFLVGDGVLLAYTRRCFNNLFCNSTIARPKTLPYPRLAIFKKLYMLKMTRRAQVLLEIDFKVFNSKNNSNYKP